jgi:hypothetical protein
MWRDQQEDEMLVALINLKQILEGLCFTISPKNVVLFLISKRLPDNIFV